MKYQIENAYDCRDEAEHLIAIHNEQVNTHKDHKPLRVDWQRFKRMTEAGMCRTATVRTDDGELVGYMATFLMSHIHYDMTIAINDAVFVHPDYRGIAAYRLFKFAIDDLKVNSEATIFNVHMKIHLPFRRLLAKLGFDQTEESWELVL